MDKCWICGTEYELECPECGAPQPLGPVQADYDRLRAEEDDKREQDDTDYSDDNDYARDVCVPRHGPI